MAHRQNGYRGGAKQPDDMLKSHVKNLREVPPDAMLLTARVREAWPRFPLFLACQHGTADWQGQVARQPRVRVARRQLV
jgi:hypothetical protein